MLSPFQTIEQKACRRLPAVWWSVFLGLVLPIPGYCQYLTPLYGATFDEAAFPLTGWTAMPSGAGQFQPAAVSIGLIPTSPTLPAYSNGRGVIISAAPGQGSFVYGPAVTVGTDLVLLRLSVHALSGGGSIAMGALNVTPGGTLANADGSANYALEAGTERFTADYEFVFAVYRPQGQAIVPFFQLAVNPGMPSAVTAMFDNFEVYPLNAQTVTDPAWRFIFGFGGIGTPTPTPTPPPGATPTMTPTVTPTLPPATGGLEPGEVYSISPTSDLKEAFSPKAAYDRENLFAVVASDLTEGFQDILLRQVDIGNNTVSNPIAVNQGYEDTVAQTPDIEIDAGGIRHVVWSDNRSRNPKLFSIYLAELNASGRKLAENDFEVNNLYENTNTAEPALAVRGNGEITVCWRDDRNFLMDVFVRRMRWTGSALQTIDAKDYQVNIPYDNTNVSHPDVAVDDQNNIVVIWSDDRVLLKEGGKKRNDIYARFFNSSTQPEVITTETVEIRQLPESVPEIQINTLDDKEEQAKDPVIAFAKGVFLAVWRNTHAQAVSSIRGAVFNALGQILVPEFQVDMGLGKAMAPSVAAWGDGRFLITWHDEGTKQMLGCVYDSVQNALLTDDVPLVEGVEGLERTGLAVGGANTGLSVWDGVTGQYKDIFGVSILMNTNTLMAVTRPVSVTDAEGRVRTQSVTTMSMENTRTAKEIKSERVETNVSRPR
ncbi:MAG: hypothetical protein ACE15F_08660 [bacterium]